MIRIEITIGRAATAPDGQQSQPPVAARHRLRVASPWRAVVPSAVAALLFSFVAAPNAPYAAASGAAQQVAYVPVCAPSAAALPSYRPLTLDADVDQPASPAVAQIASSSARSPIAESDDDVAAASPTRMPTDMPSAPTANSTQADVERVIATQTPAAPQARAVARAPTAAMTSDASVVSGAKSMAADHATNAAADSPADDLAASATADAPRRRVAMSFAIERSLSSGEDALINDVTALLNTGNWADARAKLEQRHQWQSSVPLAKLAARAALTANAAADAVVALQAVGLKLDGEGRRLLAAALMRADRPAEASDIYRALLISEPTNAEIWMGLALALDASSAAHDAVVYAYQQARDLSHDARLRRFAELRLAALA